MHEISFVRLTNTISCPECRGKSKRFGYLKSGKRRYRCLSCSKTFVRERKKWGTPWQDFKDWYRYVKGRVNREELGDQRKRSRQTISSRFHVFLAAVVSPELVWGILPPHKAEEKWCYGVDGKWLHREGVFLIHRDITHKQNLWWSYVPSESYAAFDNDVKRLVRLLGTNTPASAVSDWKRAIQMAVGQYFGLIPHQRCLAHVIRYSNTLLPKRSPLLATRRLRAIGKSLLNVENDEEKGQWLHLLTNWGYEYGHLLIEKTVVPSGSRRKWWYTHGSLRRGWRLLTTDTDSFFSFLTTSGLPKTNNSLEGVNRNLNGKLGDRRGLVISYQVSFLSWVMAFSRVHTDTQLKQLWVEWKRRRL